MWLDPAVAVTLFALTCAELLASSAGATRLTWAMLGGAAGTLPLAWRRRFPLATHATLVAGNAVAVVAVGHANLLGLLLAWVFSGYSVASHSKGWRAITGLVLQALPVVGFAEVQPPGSDAVGPAQVLLMVVPWLAGKVVRDHRVESAILEEKNRRLENETTAKMLLAAAEERARISRDVHDVVAHSVSVMVVQAEAADALLAYDPDGARESLHSIQRTGRDALFELRQALTMWKSSDGDTATTAPSLAQLPDLIDKMTQLGLEVVLEIEGERRNLPLSVDSTAYSVVREALTNTLKHAGPVASNVRLRFQPHLLVVEVADTGNTGSASTARPGHGLAGIRERVAVCGGQLEIDRTDEGGFLVRATLPVGKET